MSSEHLKTAGLLRCFGARLMTLLILYLFLQENTAQIHKNISVLAVIKVYYFEFLEGSW